MKITVIVKPHAHHTLVEPLQGGAFTVSVTAPASEGQANEAVVDALAEHFGVPPSRVRIAKGARSKRKIVEIV